jgi:hypothetical protein
MSRDRIAVQQRPLWMRHDAHLWIRPDAARFLPPGMDPADVFPALAHKRAVADAAFDAEIERSRRELAALREEVNELKAALARRRLEEAKYSPTQPNTAARARRQSARWAMDGPQRARGGWRWIR